MSDKSRSGEPSGPPENVFTRNADAFRRVAQSSERKGLEHLERGMFISAMEKLSEVVETYRNLGDTTRASSAEQYFALALYERGDVAEAVSIWEDLVASGWDRPTTLNFLVRHYESIGSTAEVERIYAHLERARDLETGFFEEFPVVDDAAEAEDTAPAAARILIADNDPAVRKVLGRILQHQGYTTLDAIDGTQAVASVFEHDPDLIFLDIYMPGQSGLDVLYRIRAEGMTTPVIVISGRPHATMIQDAKVLGAQFVAKPLDFEQVIGMVSDLLEENAS